MHVVLGCYVQVTVSFPKSYPRIHTLATSGSYYHQLSLLFFVLHYFRPRSKSPKPGVIGPRQLDDFYKSLSFTVWLRRPHIFSEAQNQTPTAGWAAAPLLRPFYDLRLKIGVSDRPLPVPSPGTQVSPLIHREKDCFERLFLASNTYVKLTVSLGRSQLWSW